MFLICLTPGLGKKVLSNFPVENIWGVGRNIAKKLKALNIITAKNLRDANLKEMRKKFSVVMERLIEELRGNSCLPLEDIQKRKQIISSRSFGRAITQLEELEHALSCYVARACLKLRRQKSRANGIYIFLHTNKFNPDAPQYANCQSSYFVKSSHCTSYITAMAKKCLKQIYRSGYAYKKVGLILLDLVDDEYEQFDLLSVKDRMRSDVLMNTMDEINMRFGKKSIFLSAEGVCHPWAMQSNFRTPNYTTCWEELLII